MPRKIVKKNEENKPKSEALKTFETSLDGVLVFVQANASLKFGKKIISYTRDLEKWTRERNGKMPNIVRISRASAEMDAYIKFLHFMRI
jgi:hypothetical protein